MSIAENTQHLPTAENDPVLLSETRPPCWLFNVPFTPMALDETAQEMERLIQRNVPSYIITANVNYVMFVEKHPDLLAVNQKAAVIVADGSPLVRISRLTGRPLPERVTGRDLLLQFSELAARKGRRLFLLGAAPGVAELAAQRLCERYPGLQIVGVEAPMLKDLTPAQHDDLLARVRAARPDVLVLAFNQPDGERWMHRHHEALAVPLIIQVGSAVNHAAGVTSRAPHWMRRAGLEALYRWYQEPFRLTPRYSRNALFLAKALARFALDPNYRCQDRAFPEGPHS